MGFDFLFITDHNSILSRHEFATNSTASFLALTAGKRALGGAVYLRYQPSGATVEIQSSAGPGGSIDPAGTVTLPAGASTNFVITSTPDFRIADLKTNGVTIGLAFDNQTTHCQWTWPNITQSETILAGFLPRLTPNGIPYPWLSLHNITNRLPSVEQDDPDQDGWTTWQEFIADTNPSDPSSCVPRLTIRRGPGDLPELVVDPTSPQSLYTILSRPGLAPALSWETNTSTAGTGSNHVHTLTHPTSATYYILQINR